MPRADLFISADVECDGPIPGPAHYSMPHTHNALDDALEQAELFANIWAWPGTR
jgi:hypothetical protein